METARNFVMVREGNFVDPAVATAAPCEAPMDLTKRPARDEPQDLRVRINGGNRNSSVIAPNHKRERLEEMVNHIRRCHRQSSPSDADRIRTPVNINNINNNNNPSESGSESDTSENGNSSWRPEDIFILTADASNVEDLSVRRTRTSTPPSSPTRVRADHHNHHHHRWTPRIFPDWQRAYLPWMAYYAHLVHAGTSQDDSSSTPEEDRGPTETPPPPPVASSSGGRKRAPRALTGKHVKHGTGASPSTLMSLRQKIEQRQKKTRESKPKPKVHKK